MKKAFIFFLSIIMLLSATACDSNTESGGNSENKSADIVQTSEPIRLVNKMT